MLQCFDKFPRNLAVSLLLDLDLIRKYTIKLVNAKVF